MNKDVNFYNWYMFSIIYDIESSRGTVPAALGVARGT